ncbi:unnamed protein product, partial [Calicophoron daubneyi]
IGEPPLMACRFILKALSARPQLLAARLRSKSNVHSNSTEVPDPSGSPSFDTFPVVNFPVDKEESTEQGLLIPRIDLSHVGCASALGRLESNEDRLLACELSPFLRFFGIFDGHGGPQAADFALAVMPECVRYRLAELTNVYRKRGLSLRSIHPKYLEQVLENAFLEVNNLMSRHFLYYTTAHIRQSTGTTATVVLMRHSYQLVIGHVGDSRALICRKGRIEPLTVNHDPSTLVRLSDLIKGDEGDGITESDRIVASGGHVTTSSLGVPVVNGRLGMTRSLGDLPLKAFGVSAHPQLLSLKACQNP